MLKAFYGFLTANALIPRHVAADGRWTRCGTETHPNKRNGSYMLAADGRFGLCQNWETMTECAVWRAGGESAREAQLADNSAAVERERLRRESEQRGTKIAKERYEAATPLLDAAHPYLAKKRIETMAGCRGLRVDETGGLLVPMYRWGKLTSCQRIAADGAKLFASGAPVKGAYFALIRPKSPVTLVCEGLATAITCFQAVQTASVVCCFSAANLISVAERLDWPGMVAVCADNDHETERRIGKNPGVEAATKAAGVIGCGVAFPESADGITDWNDFFVDRLERLEAKAEFGPKWEANPGKLRAAASAVVAAGIMRHVRKAEK